VTPRDGALIAGKVVEEDETVLAFAFALRKQAAAGGAGVSPMGMPLGKAKPKPGFAAQAPKGKLK
jgi:hypothetical protein